MKKIFNAVFKTPIGLYFVILTFYVFATRGSEAFIAGYLQATFVLLMLQIAFKKY